MPHRSILFNYSVSCDAPLVFSRPIPLLVGCRLTPTVHAQILVNDGLEEAYEELKATAEMWYPQLAEEGEKHSS